MKPTPVLIGLAGNKFGAGKGTVAEYLIQNHGFAVYSFGGALKREVQVALTDEGYRSMIWEHMPEVTCDALLTCLALGQLDPFLKPTTPEMRLLLQTYGTEYRRAQDPDYWVKAAFQAIEVENPERVVFDDMRFDNEYDFVKERGGETWLVVRDSDAYAYTNLTRHASEGGLDLKPFDWVVYNDATIEDLQGLVRVRMATYDRPGCRGCGEPDCCTGDGIPSFPDLIAGGSVGSPQGSSLHV